MIIRSQDKESIINFDAVDTLRLSRISEIGVNQEEYQTRILYDANDTFGVLDTYSTEEKAIEVMDRICEEYVKYTSLEDVLGSVHGIHILPKYYQMPADNEVEV